MTPLFLNLEYNRPGFPEDDYGFTREDRLKYAPFAIEYILGDADISNLSRLALSDGVSLFTRTELAHLTDVRAITRIAIYVLYVGSITALLIGGIGWWMSTIRKLFWRGLFDGSILTVSIIGVIVVLAITRWDFFFTSFHQLLFESGTWQFAYSDTLIRLFPEQLWFDAALVVGTLTTTGAGIILVVSWRKLKAAPV